MHLVLLIPIVVVMCIILFDLGSTGTWGMNKTVGWAWDLSNFNLIHFPLYFLFLIIYTVLSLFKIKTQFLLSIIHIFLIVIPWITFSNYNYTLITFYSTALSLIVFVLNVALSIKNRKIYRPKTIS